MTWHGKTILFAFVHISLLTNRIHPPGYHSVSLDMQGKILPHQTHLTFQDQNVLSVGVAQRVQVVDQQVDNLIVQL